MPNTILTKRKSSHQDITGLVYSINYDLHIQHLLAEMAKAAGNEMRVSLRRVELQVRAGKQTRIQALSREIARLERTRG